MRSQWKAVIGSSICLASVPTLALAANHAPETHPSRDSVDPNLTPNPVAGRLSSRTKSSSPANLRDVSSTKTRHLASAQAQDMSSQLIRLKPAVNRQTASQHKPHLRYITVHAGDSLWSVSHRYHVSLWHLEQWNHLSVDSLLPIGIRLTMNGQNPSPAKVHKMPKPGRTRSPSVTPVHSTKTSLSSRNENTTGALAQGVRGLGVIQYAKQFIGTPYVWGGESPGGFDCSGFVQFVYAHFGTVLGRTTYQQFDEGTPVYRADLLPGDLLFFNTYGSGPSHVGMYVGSGTFIAASGSRVQVMSMSLAYWQDHYVGARRV